MKINKKKRVIERFLAIGILFVMLFPLVSAGIGSRYSLDSPLQMYAGESKEIKFASLQNLLSGKDELYNGVIAEGSEIAEIVGEALYDVPSGSKDIPITLKVSIPEEAQIGAGFRILMNFQDTTPAGEGMVAISKSVSWAIQVDVIEKPAEAEPVSEGMSTTTIVLLVLGIIIIIAIIWFVVKKKKQ